MLSSSPVASSGVASKRRFIAIAKVTLAVEVGLYVGSQRAHGQHGIAQAGFGAVKGVAPVVHFISGLDVDSL